MLDVIAIEMALEKFRKKFPESYVDVDDTETVISILQSAGMFGSLAAEAQRELRELQRNIDKVVEEILT